MQEDTLTPGSAPSAFDSTGSNTAAHAVIVQWQTGDDGIYRTRTVFPVDDASAEFQLTAGLQAMLG